MPETQRQRWLADDPIDGTPESPDSLSRDKFSADAVAALESVAAESASSVVALIGPWGSGKSSLLNMISRGVSRSRRQWITVGFNPWFYQDLPSLQAGFFRELSTALPDDDSSWKGVRKKLSNMGRTIAPLGSLGALVGFDATKAIEFASNIIGGDESLAKTRMEADEALKHAGQPVLVVIDDLDRLSPDELLLVFKLIRLTGRLTNLYYLVSYDEDTLLDALSRTGLIGETNERRGLEYLEKIIQLRLDVPPLRDSQIGEWIDSGLGGLASQSGLALNEGSVSRFNDIYNEYMRRRLDTPRSIKRYFGQLEAFFGTVHDEVDSVDFLLLTWIRTAEPLVYDLIYRHRREILGIGSLAMKFRTDKIAPEVRQEFWQAALEGAKVASGDLEGVAGVLGELFPAFKAEWAGVKHDTSRDIKGPRIAHVDYFDRYFSFGVPVEDVSDHVVRMAVDQISNRSEGPERLLIEESFPAKTILILSKFGDLIDSDGEVDRLALLEWLVQRQSLVPDPNGVITAKDHLRWLTQRIFVMLSPAQAKDALRIAASISGGLALAVRWVYAVEQSMGNFLDNNPEVDRLDELYDEVKPACAQLVAAALENYKNVPPFEIPGEVWSLIWGWRELDSLSVKTFLRARIAAGQWSALDTVARMVTSARILGVSAADWKISELDHAAVDDFVGFDWIVEQLHADIDSVVPDAETAEGTLATPDNRRTYVLQQLRAIRDGRLVRGYSST